MSVRITILVKKLDHLSNAEFHDYWSNEHPKIWLSVPIVTKNLTKYSQFHVNNDITDALKQQGHIPVAEYDGGAEMYGNSIEQIMAVFQNEEYQRVVIPDEQKFLKREEAKVMVGWDDVKWMDGKRI